MLELLALLTIVGIGVAVLAVIFVVGLLLKLTFRLLLLPFVLLGGLLKVLLIVGVVVVGLALAPVFFGVLLLLALPLLLLLGLFGIGWAATAA